VGLDERHTDTFDAEIPGVANFAEGCTGGDAVAMVWG
jgi:hypothetical protein